MQQTEEKTEKRQVAPREYMQVPPTQYPQYTMQYVPQYPQQLPSKKHSKGFWVTMIVLGVVGLLMLSCTSLLGVSMIVSPVQQHTTQVPTEQVPPTTQPKQATPKPVVVAQPLILGKESDFTAKYGAATQVSQADLQKYGLDKYVDSAVTYEVNGHILLVEIKNNVVVGLAGYGDYKQFFPAYVKDSYGTSNGMDMYYVTPDSATGTIGEIAVNHSSEPWSMTYIAYPAQ